MSRFLLYFYGRRFIRTTNICLVLIAVLRCGGDLWNLQEVITPRISPTIDTPEIKETKPFLRLERKYCLEI